MTIKLGFLRSSLEEPIIVTDMNCNSKLWRLKITDKNREYLYVCPHCYYDNSASRTRIYASDDNSNFKRHLSRHPNEVSPVPSPTKPTKDGQEMNKEEPISEEENLNLNIQLKKKFSKFGCYSDEMDFIKITSTKIGIVKNLLRSGLGYGLTGCWIYNERDIYRDFLEMRLPRPDINHMALHSILCELGHDLTHRSDAHIRCCRPSHLRWGLKDENTLDRDTRQLMEEDPEFIEKCNLFQNQIKQLYLEFKSVSIQDKLLDRKVKPLKLSLKNNNFKINNNNNISQSFSSFTNSTKEQLNYAINDSVDPSFDLDLDDILDLDYEIDKKNDEFQKQFTELSLKTSNNHTLLNLPVYDFGIKEESEKNKEVNNMNEKLFQRDTEILQIKNTIQAVSNLDNNININNDNNILHKRFDNNNPDISDFEPSFSSK